jgi:hypothetical protein
MREAYNDDLPQPGNNSYHEYPFVVVKRKHNGDGQAQFEVFIYSRGLREMILEALGLDGAHDMSRPQDGAYLLRAWDDLRQYLYKKRKTYRTPAGPWSPGGGGIAKEITGLRHTIGELELLVHVFLENWDILSAVGINELLEQGYITSHHHDAINERMSVHRELDDLADMFRQSGDRSELYFDNMKSWSNKMQIKLETLKAYYRGYPCSACLRERSD